MCILRTLLVVGLTMFATASASAAEQKCNNEPTLPSTVFITAVEQRYPSLEVPQKVAVARLYEMAYNQDELANNITATASERDFAVRAKQIAMRAAAIELSAYTAVPRMKSVLEKMKTEEALRGEWVSEELEDEVRATAQQIIVLSLAWTELSHEIAALLTDRFVAFASQHGITPDTLTKLKQSVCALEAVNEHVAGITEYFPTAVTLAYVERMKY